MSELIQEFTANVVDGAGRLYTARARGRIDSTGLWHGWLEFVPRDGGRVLQTGQETTQSKRELLQDWAAELSPDYLTSALSRSHTVDSTAWAAPVADPPRGGRPARVPDSGGEMIRMEVRTLDPHAPQHLMRREEIRVGQVRRVPGGGTLIYDGVEAHDGEPSSHRFRVQCDSVEEAAVLANHIRTQLREDRVSIVIGGHEVPLTGHDLAEALRPAR